MSVAYPYVSDSAPKIIDPYGNVTTGRRYSGVKANYPAWDSAKPKSDGTGLGAYVDPGTGNYWTGPVGTGYAQNGVFSTTMPGANPGTGLPKFDVVKTVKQPEVAGGVASLLAQQNAQQTALAPDITKTLASANDVLDRSYNRTQSALDTSGVESQLNQSMAGQESAQRALTDQQAQRNIDYQAQTKSTLDKLSAQLDQGEAAAKATASDAAARALSASNLVTVGSNPELASAHSGASTNRALQAVISAMLPVSERFSQARYNQTANIEAPLNRELFQNDTALLSAKSALESQFGGNWRNIYQYIQGLKQQAAQMDQASADRFIAQKLNLLGVPAQLLNGQISNLARLQQLDALANEYTLNTPYQPNRIAPTPTYPVTPGTRTYSSNGGGGYDVNQILAALKSNQGVGSSVDPNAKVNDLRAGEAARQDYIRQTGVDPTTDQYFNPDLWNNLKSRYTASPAV